MTDDEFKMALERLEAINEEVYRMNQAFAAMKDGMSYEQAFSEYVCSEVASEKKTISSKLATLMQHLLKFKYCTNSYQDNDWKRTINHSIDKIKVILRWKSKKKDVTLIKHAISEMNDSYDEAVELYKDDAKWFPDLADGIKFIPEKCPWTLEDLMDNDPGKLMAALPDPDYTKMYLRR